MLPLKFLPGLVIAQAAAAVLVLAALDSPVGVHIAAFLGIAAIVLLMLALWFGSIGEHIRKDALLEASAAYAREREHLVVSAEAEKRSMLEETHARMIKETNRAYARANLKLGAALACLVGIGGLLLVVEFISIGLMTLAAAGGVLAGYVMRARQDALKRRELPFLLPEAAEEKTLPPPKGG